MKKVNQNLLVSLDVLLDTRLATLAKMNMQYPQIVLENGWKNRSGDFYSKWIDGFDQDLFNTHYWYRGRDGDIHTNALMTGYMSRLMADVKILRAQSENHPLAGEITLDINIWPYDFADDEKEALKSVMREYLGDIKVGIVRASPGSLAPKTIRGKWCSFSVYNFDEWFELHREALLDTPIPSVVCVAPRLLKKPLDEDMDIDPTVAVSGALVEFLGVEWITPQEVSIVI